MTDKPIISIIMASYNHADFINAAIESVRQQDYEHWELLIADDASTDNTLQILESYANDSRIKIFSFKINRQHHMRNFAAEHARGDYIAFLNSDDVFLPGKLRKQAEFLNNNSQLSAIFTHVRCVDEKNKRIEHHPLEKIFAVDNRSRHEWLQHFFTSGNCLCISSALIRRNCFENTGKFNPLLIQISDLDLWIRTCLQGDIHIIPEMLTSMRILGHGKNLSDASPAVMSRLLLENQHTYDHYFSPKGIEQAVEIFPEFENTLPEDTPQWRHYLLCLKLIALPHRPMKLAGFTKLHELLADQKTTATLMQKNPRLLRHMFLWEGASGLNGNAPYFQWTVNTLENKENTYSYWTAALKKEPVCLSIPNPRRTAQLCLNVAGKDMPFSCKQFRVYNQRTGKCVFDMDASALSEIKNTRIYSVKSFSKKIIGKRSSKQSFCFPEIDFAEFESKWIDIEIDCVPIPSAQ
ncbi:MAG: glycosyltransferase [Phycisphaerae bacterium]|nr:glycosyltransferase [Phycisphaerae bacterium]